MSVVFVCGLCCQYGDCVVIDNFDLCIDEGEFVVLLGESGCGKIMLLWVLVGLDLIDGGYIDVLGKFVVVFQEYCLLLWMLLWQNVVLGIEMFEGCKVVVVVLGEVGFVGCEEDWLCNFLGGQVQWVVLVWVLVRELKFLLLDEFFVVLDVLICIKMYVLICELVVLYWFGVLLVMYDVDEVVVIVDCILVMWVGWIVVLYQVRGSIGLCEVLLKEFGVESDICVV